MDSDLLSFRSVGYAYPNGGRLAERFPALRRHALHDVTFSVKRGAAIALLGSNGSGKTTLLQLCNALLVPDAGTVSWCGKPLDRSRSGLARLRSEAGLLFQDPDDQLFAGSLREDVAFGPCNQGLDAHVVRERVDEVLDRVGLREFADLPPHVLSHGMRKRAALAGVLATLPRLLLLDEPTAGLDPRSEERLMDVLTDLVADGASVLLATHDLDLARRFADQALVLAEGNVVAFEGIDEVLDSHETLAAAGLLRRASWRRPSREGTSGGSDISMEVPACEGRVS